MTIHDRWQDDAPCTFEPDTFNSPKMTQGHTSGKFTIADLARLSRAKMLCDTCPVIASCRADALVQKSEGFRHGELWVWRTGTSASKPRLVCIPVPRMVA